MRVFNRLLVFVLGLALAALGFVVAVEAVWLGFGYRILWFPGQSWLHTLRTTPYSTRSVEVGAAVAALVGLALLTLEARPWRKRLAHISAESDGTWLVTRRSTERHLARRLSRAVPTTPITARLRIGARRWRLQLRAHAAATTQPVLEAAAKEELDRLGAPAGSRVLVHTTRPEGKVQ